MLTKYRRADHGMTTSHFMCGAGGETLGFALEGFEPTFNTNHSPLVIRTIAENFANTDTKVADVSNIDFRKLPRTVGGTGSPICTEGSPASGRARKTRKHLNLVWNPAQGGMIEAEPVSDGVWEKTRLTAYCTLRAAEVCNYDFFVCENVTEFATDWPLFTWWLGAWDILGYNVTIQCVTSAHIALDDVEAVAQWRDRIVIVFTKKGIPTPDLEVRPWAPCVCGEDVQAERWWKSPEKSRVGPYLIGKFRQQYLYVTPHGGSCGRAVVEPYIMPTSSIVEWSNLGTRVGARKRPIVPARRERIQQGLDQWYGQPYVTMARRNTNPTSITEPVAAITTSGTQHYLTVPHAGAAEQYAWPDESGIVVHYRNSNRPTTTAQPLPTISTKESVALVIPHRREDRITTTNEPRPTVLTRDFTRLAVPAPAVDDVLYRMFTSKEHLRAQGFPDWYRVLGNSTERNLQAGNAFSVNVARWVARQVRTALDSRSAA